MFQSTSGMPPKEVGLERAETLQRRKEQQKQWHQRHRDLTKYLTSRASVFLPSKPPRGPLYTDIDLLTELATVVRAAKSKQARLALLTEPGGQERVRDTLCAKTLGSGVALSQEPIFVLVHKCEREDRSADLSHDLRVVSSTPAVVAEWGLRVGDDFSRVVEPHDLPLFQRFTSRPSVGVQCYLRLINRARKGEAGGKGASAAGGSRSEGMPRQIECVHVSKKSPTVIGMWIYRRPQGDNSGLQVGGDGTGKPAWQNF